MTSNSSSKSSTTIIVKGGVKFPAKCVVCGQSSNIETVFISGEPYGFWLGVWKWLFGMTPEIAVPAHKECGKTLKKGLLRKNVHLMILSAIAGGAGLYFDLDLLVIGLIITAVITPSILWQIRNPLPVEFAEVEGNLRFKFRDSNYACEFAALNVVAWRAYY